MKYVSPCVRPALVRLLLGLILLLGLSVQAGTSGLVAHAQPAATITITTCDESHLDQAISSASSGDTITFGCSGDIALTQTLNINTNLTLDGSGQQVTLDGQNSVRVLIVNQGVTFTFNALTVAHGFAQLGGGVLNFGTLNISNSIFANNNSANDGGGVLSFGTLNISTSIFANNNSARFGGGLYNEGATLNISTSTFANNSASFGGGFYNEGTVNISTSTFANNSASGSGGSLENNGGTVNISNSTFANNSASFGSGLDNTSTGTASISTSLFANNSGGNCANGTITDQGYNLSSDNTCGFIASTSQQNTDPKLDPNGLHDNGGPTQTIALQQGSPAIDLIPTAQCPTTDQRGMSRPDDKETSCDIGAYESNYQPPDAPLTLTRFVAGPLGHRSAGVAATFTDADPNGQVSDYTATVSWGDGTTSTVKVIKNPLGKGFALAGLHSYTKKGTYTVTLTVADRGGSQISKTVTITVK
jgi:PKD domain